MNLIIDHLCTLVQSFIVIDILSTTAEYSDTCMYLFLSQTGSYLVVQWLQSTCTQCTIYIGVVLYTIGKHAHVVDNVNLAFFLDVLSHTTLRMP